MKKYIRIFPSSLLARSILIVLFPVVLLQAVMAVIIIDRHFRDVTVQMTKIAAKEVQFMLQNIGPTLPVEQGAFFDIKLQEIKEIPLVAEPFLFYDYTGRISAKVFEQNLTGLVAYDYNQDKRAFLYISQGARNYLIELSRKRLAPFNVHQLLVNMVFFGIVLSIVAILYLKNQVRSITRLTAAAEAFGRGRNIPYTPAGAAEVRLAGQAFLAMRRRIERFLTQRTLLLASISHDLRTPITRLRLALSMQEENLETRQMTHDVLHMEKLLNEVLEFGKGVVSGQLDSIDLVALIDLHALKAFDQSYELNVSGRARPVRLRVLAMERALDNVLSNASKYAKNIHIKLHFQDKEFTLVFEDDGPGIDPAQSEELLQPFIRGDTARTSHSHGEGLGLGLAIVQDVVQAHGGSIVLGKSASLGGLSVRIWMPR